MELSKANFISADCAVYALRVGKLPSQDVRGTSTSEKGLVYKIEFILRVIT